MKDEIREQISALVDDELTDLERPLLLGRLQRDADLRACMGRYQLIGDVIHGGVTQASGLGIAGRVQDALADDHKDQDSSTTIQDVTTLDRQETGPFILEACRGVCNCCFSCFGGRIVDSKPAANDA